MRSQLKTNAQHSGRCMSPVVSRFPTRGTSQRAALQHLDSRRLRPPVRALHGRLEGRQSGHVDDVCTHLTALCAAVDLPVNADFEGGFAHEAEKVAINVARG